MKTVFFDCVTAESKTMSNEPSSSDSEMEFHNEQTQAEKEFLDNLVNSIVQTSKSKDHQSPQSENRSDQDSGRSIVSKFEKMQLLRLDYAGDVEIPESKALDVTVLVRKLKVIDGVEYVGSEKLRANVEFNSRNQPETISFYGDTFPFELVGVAYCDSFDVGDIEVVEKQKVFERNKRNPEARDSHQHFIVGKSEQPETSESNHRFYIDRLDRNESTPEGLVRVLTSQRGLAKEIGSEYLHCLSPEQLKSYRLNCPEDRDISFIGSRVAGNAVKIEDEFPADSVLVPRTFFVAAIPK